MATITVSGNDTPAIHTARDAARIGGTIFFPNGTYDASGVTASVANQTWQFERSAILLRNAAAPAGAVITQTATGLKVIGGVLDGNSANNSTPGNGIYAPSGGCDLELDGTTIQNTTWYGIASQDCVLVLNRVSIFNTLQNCIDWHVTAASRGGIRGPQVDHCVFDRSTIASPQNGLINIYTTDQNPVPVILDPRVTNSNFRMQYPGTANSLAITVNGSANLHVMGNTCTGGHTGISVGPVTHGDVIVGNACEYSSAYGIEYGGDRGIISLNTILGVGGVTIAGIIGNGCTNSKASDNQTLNCGVPVQIVTGSQLQNINNS